LAASDLDNRTPLAHIYFLYLVFSDSGGYKSFGFLPAGLTEKMRLAEWLKIPRLSLEAEMRGCFYVR
jgi:hypothetical protein